MLGTRIILLAMSSLPDAGNEPEAEVICAANHEIPLFWLMPFSSGDLRHFEVAAEQSGILSHTEKATYPVLVAERSKLLERLEQRLLLLKPIISEQDADLLQRWVGFLSEQSAPVIAMDTYELWCNSGQPDRLAEDILARLTQFDALNSDVAKNTLDNLKQEGVWQEGNQIALAGFGW